MTHTTCPRCGFTPELKIVPKLEPEHMHPSRMNGEPPLCLQGWRKITFGGIGENELAQTVNDRLMELAGGRIDKLDRLTNAHEVWNDLMQSLPGVSLQEMSVWRESCIEQPARLAG